MLTLYTYDGKITVNRDKLAEIVRQEYDMTVEEFMANYTWDDAEYVRYLVSDREEGKIYDQSPAGPTRHDQKRRD